MYDIHIRAFCKVYQTHLAARVVFASHLRSGYYSTMTANRHITFEPCISGIIKHLQHTRLYRGQTATPIRMSTQKVLVRADYALRNPNTGTTVRAARDTWLYCRTIYSRHARQTYVSLRCRETLSEYTYYDHT